MDKEVKILNKKLILKISLIALTIIVIIGIIFIYIVYSKLFDNSIPIIERPDEYITDYTPPEDITEAEENEEPTAAQEVDAAIPVPTKNSDIPVNPQPSVVQEVIDDNLQPPVDQAANEDNPQPPTDESSPSTKPDGKNNNANKNDNDSDIIYASPKKQTPIYKKDKISEDVLNILLLGSDSRDPKIDRGRSDSMMVLSYNKTKRTATLLSLQRDSLIPIEDHGWNRINTAYFFGGVGLIINTINDLFDLDIQYYAIINFEGFTTIVDKIGGVDVTLTKAEADYYNKSNGWTLKEGVNTLNGAQALAHSQNRTTGSESDFGRTKRQRAVLLSIYKKCIKLKDFATITALIELGLTKVNTNLPPDIIYSIATDVISGETPELITAYMPFKDTWKSVWYKKMSVIQIDIKENKNQIKELLY